MYGDANFVNFTSENQVPQQLVQAINMLRVSSLNLAQSATLAFIGGLLDEDSASQLMAICVLYSMPFVALAFYRPYTNK